MQSIDHLLKELEPVREASTEEASQALVSALWRRTQAEIAELSIHFADAGFLNLASVCRTIAAVKTEG